MRNARPLDAVNTQPTRTFSRLKLYAAVLAASQWMASGQVWAAPEGGQVVGGEGVIQQAGVETIITQATERMAIDWRSFDVAANERVEFIQPNSSSIALNRVLSNRGSEILGRIDANGQVMLVNANGVVFGKDSVINVGGMIASGLNIDPASFINGDFALNSIDGAEGKVINYGIINAATGGSVTLVGEQVRNDGLISAKLGAVNLVAGNAAVLTFDPSGMVGVRVTDAVVQDELGVDAAVINNGTINAEAGRVLLSASVSEDVFSNAVNNAGMNKSSSVVVHDDGSFTLGAGADLINTGDISVSTSEGNAGQVVALGNNITHSGSISADTTKGAGGSIELHSTDKTLVTQNAKVSAQAAAKGEGGDVKVLGNKVGLFDRAEINASGANGGGQVLIGGDKTGDNKKIRNADFIYLGENSAVKTDALVNGNGGKLITFASDTARIYGNLYSRGGSEGGNGGFIETSGLKGFEILNTPDITAVAGTGGTWLIDPYNIVISGTQSTNITLPSNGNNTFASTGAAILRNETLTGALTNGATVIVQTGGSAGDNQGNGDITISNRIRFNINDGSNGDGSATLRLLAHNNINVNAAIERDNDTDANNNGQNNSNNTGRGLLNLELIANKDNLGNDLVNGGGSIIIQSGRTIATNGGYFYAGKSESTLANGQVADKTYNFTSTGATINTSNDFGGGDIVINATNNVDLGAVSFKHLYTNAQSPAGGGINGGDNLLRVGSITINSGADVTLNSEIDFNDTGRRQGDTGNDGYPNDNLDGEEAFLTIAANGSITIKERILDKDYGDYRDSLNITLTADKDNLNGGTVNIEKDIYTAGGNFIASAAIFDSTGAIINTDRANERTNDGDSGTTHGNAQWSNGGDVDISARNSIILGSIITDGSCSAPAVCTGNLSLTVTNPSSQPSDDVISQASGSVLNIAGTSTFNTGTGGNIDLSNLGNIFNGNLLFTSAGNVELAASVKPTTLQQPIDTIAITLGVSRINGTLKLTSGGNITQDGDLYVGGTTELIITNGATNKNVDLSNAANDFGQLVTITNANNVSLRDENNLSLAALTTAGDITLQAGTGQTNKIILNGNISTTAGTVDDKNIVLNSDAELASNLTIQTGTGAISFNGTVNSNNTTAKTLTLTGGNITLDGAIGNSQALGAVVLNSSALVSISAPEIKASSFSVIGVGAAADLTLTNLTNNWSVTGAKQGMVQRLDNNVAISPLISFSGIRNISGGSGVDNFVIQPSGTIASINGGAGVNTLTGRDAANTWEMDGNNQGVLKQGTTNYVNQFTNIQNLIGGTANDTFNFTNSNGVITGSINGGTGAGLNTILGRNEATTWTLTGANAGNVKITAAPGTTYINGFTNIQTLQGGSEVDIFNLAFAFTGTVKGGAGADIFNVNAATNILQGEAGNDSFLFNSTLNAGSAASIDGGAIDINEQNKIIARDKVANTWSMTGNAAGSLGVTDTSIIPYVTGFNHIQVFTGAGSDTMSFASFVTVANNPLKVILGETGSTGVITYIGNSNIVSEIIKTDGTNVWTITGENEGTVQEDALPAISFFNFNKLTGGTGKDTFDFSKHVDSKITGAIDGGATAEGNEIKARKKDVNDVDISNIWSMTDNESGSVALTDDPLVPYVASFTDIQIFTGAGSDTLSYAGVTTNDVKVTLGATGATGITLFEGNDLSNSEFITSDGTNTWAITGANQGMVSGFSFSKFWNLTGGSGADTFDFTSGAGSISGTINGGTGAANTILGRNVDTTWTLTNPNAGNVKITDTPGTPYIAGFTNIQNLTGGTAADIFDFTTTATGQITGSINGGAGAGLNTILGRNDATTWALTGADAGNVKITAAPGTTYIGGFTNIQTLQGGNAADIFNLAFAFTGIVKGGASADVFNVNAVTNILQGEAGDDSFFFNSTSNAGSAASIDGGAAGENNSLSGRNASNSWAMTAANVGSLGITNGITYLNEFKNIQTLQGGNAADIFNLAFAFAGTVKGGAGADVFNVNAVTNILQGEAGNDSFLFDSLLNAGSAASIDGGGATGENNSLSGRNASNSWTMTAANVGSLGITNGATYLNKFENIQTLQGGSEVDIFNLAFAFAGTVKGGASADVFNVNAVTNILQGEAGDDSFFFNSASNAGSAAIIDGGAAGENNSLSGRNASNSWAMTAANVGSLGITNGATYLNKFENIQTLQGGSEVDIFNLAFAFAGTVKGGADADVFNVNAVTNILQGEAGDDSFFFNSTSNAGSAASIDGGAAGENNSLSGRNESNSWAMTAANVGSLGITNGATYLNKFENIQTLQGGSEVDIFNLAFAFTGTVKGGASADIFNVNAVANILQGEAGDDSFLFNSTSNAGSAASIDGGAAGENNSLSGRNADTTWTLTNPNAGNVKITDTPGTPYIAGFTNIQNLTGGTAADIFDFTTTATGQITGSINGGAGAGLNTILGRNDATTWALTGADAGNVKITAAPGTTYIGGFTNIQTLQGGNAADIFNLAFAFTGIVKGGASADVFNVNAVTNILQGEAGDDSFFFNSTSNAGSAASIDGGAAGENNSLSGRNASNSWAMTAANVGSLGITNGITYLNEFKNIQTLQGGNAADIFNLAFAFAGTVKGGAGADVFNVNAVTNILQGEAGNDSFLFDSLLNAGSAASIDGGGATGENNSLSGRNASNSWTMTAANVGSLGITNGATYLNKFENIQTLQGGSEVDIFNLAFAFAGTVKGGASADVFNVNAVTNILQGEAGDDSFFFNSASNAGSAAIIDGGAAGENNSLSGRNASNSWAMTAANVGSLGITNGATYLNKFENIQTLQGGSEVDIFNLAFAFAGTVKGGADADVFNVNAVTNILQGEAGDDSFFFNSTSNAGSAASIDGGAAGENNSLSGRNESNSWAMTAANVGSLGITNGATYLNKFENIQTLQGGSEVDIFNLAFAFTGTVKGGASADIFNVNAVANILQGEAGDDSFLFNSTSNAGSAASIDGGAAGENNSLSGRNADNTWNITGENAGSLGLSSGGSYVTSFKNIQTLNGGTAADNFIINAAVGNTINAGAGNNSFTINAAVENILGGDADETYIFGAAGSATSLNGGGGSNTLVGRNDNNTWTMTGANVGSLGITNGAIYLNKFENIQTLQGGSKVDIFNLAFAFTGIVKGGAGADVFNVNAVTNILQGEAGDDSFFFNSTSNAGSAASIDGGAAGENNSLSGRNASNIWNITGENAGSLGLSSGGSYVTSFNNIQTLNGGTAADNFIINAAVGNTINAGAGNNSFTINAAVGNILGGDADETFTFGAAGSATSLNGGGGGNTLVGRNDNNTWTMTAANVGSLGTTNGATYLNKFENIQTLQGEGEVDIFNLAFAFTGTVKGGAGADVFNVNAVTNILQGEAGDDSFFFNSTSNAGRAASIDGGAAGENNSLSGRNASNTWTISSTNAGKISSNSTDYVANFSNIHILNGGNASDTFSINAAAGNIFGNAGIDRFVFSNNDTGTAESIDGGANNNYLIGRNAANSWTMLGANNGSLSITNGNIYVNSFSAITNLEGGNLVDTLVAINQANTWSIDGENSGSLRAATTGAASIAFGGMENLLGNQGVDTFTFGVSGDITGLIDGGTTDSKGLNIDIVNLELKNAGVTVQLGRELNENLNIVNVEEIVAAKDVNNKLIGASDTDYQWRITANDQGIVETLVAPLLETSISFINFNNIAGGLKNDYFKVVSGQITDQIDGGEGTDFIDYSERRGHFDIALGSNSSGFGITGVTGIEGIRGNSESGVGTSTFKVNSSNTLFWKIGSSAGSSADGINDGSVIVEGSTVTFENFTNITGGSGNDQFTYLANGGWFGNIDGGGGTNNTIDASASIRNQQLHVNGAQAGVTNLNNINKLIGNSATDSRLVGTSSTNTWLVGASNGTLNASLEFSGIANLQGGADIDTFSISNLSWLTGVIDGGGESDTLDLTGMTTPITLAVDSQTQADINIVNIESINANNGVANTLIGSVNGNEWRINEINAGVLNKTISFTGFGNLTGSASVDQIIFANNIADLTGHLDMGAGQDVLDLSASGRAMTVQLNSSKASLANGVISVNAIEELKGAANQSNHLIADNYSNTWVIDAIDAGRVSSAETGTKTFTQFNRLTGGSLDDKFDFEALGKTTGLVDGGAGSTRDIVDLSKSLSANVKIASTGETTGFVNIEKYIGNSVDSTLTAADLVNNWSLSGNNSGTLNGVVEFENFGMLKGGNSKDNFMITNATISGSIDSGDGDDTFDIQSSAIAGKIKAGNGDDSFTFTILPGAQGTATIEGGDGTNRLTIAGGDANYKATHQIGRQEYTDASNNTYSILSSQINNIIDNLVANSLSILGTAAADSFRLQNARYSTNNLDTVYYTNKSNLIVNGSADDRVIVDGTLGIESTVTFNNVSVGAENDGRIQARSLELVNTGDVGSASARLNTAVTDLSLSATNGSIFLEEQDNLLLKNFNVSTTNTVDLKVGSNLTTLNPLAYTGALNIESLRGNVELGENNLLSGLLNLRANGDISLGNSQTLNIGDLTAQNANLSSGASIKANGVFGVSGKTSLNAVNDITLLNSANDINQVTITKADAAEIFDRNAFTTTGMTIVNTLNLRSSGNITVSTSCITDCANSYGVNTKNLKIQSDGVVTVAKNISATDTLTIDAQGITVNDAITSKQFLMNAGNGKLLLNESGSLLGQGGNSISLIANSLEQYSTVISNGNITATINGDVIMNDRALMESLSANVELSARNMQLSQVKATNGSVVMNAQGSIVDGNGSAANIVAGFWKADAINGIGSGIGQVSGFDAIETDVDRLSIRNAGDFNTAGQGSNINIANTGALVIEQLRNNGSITLSNANGNVVLDNTNNEKFDITNPDARVQGGVINANTGNASQLILSVNGGDIRAENKANKQNPEIIADEATFKLGATYNLGEINRQIIMHVPELYALESLYGWEVWHIRRPKLIIDLSKIPPDSFVSGRDQLIQIEELSEIDPAIFTNLRNYVHDEVAILLPSDQRFDTDEETGTYLGQY